MPRASSKDARSQKREPSTSLDSRSVEAIERFVHVLARSGCTPEEIAHEIMQACRRVPRSWAPRARAAIREMDDASHVLTLWFSDPGYLDSHGNPKPLPVRGADSSFETLVRRIDPRLKAVEVLRYLSSRGIMDRRGRRYVPRERALSLRGAGGPDHFRSFRALLGMLRTIDHNSQPTSNTAGWFEVFAENPRFPKSGRAAFDKRLRHLGMRFLYQIDADMHRRERVRNPKEKTVRLGIGIYRFEEEEKPKQRKLRRSSRGST